MGAIPKMTAASQLEAIRLFDLRKKSIFEHTVGTNAGNRKETFHMSFKKHIKLVRDSPSAQQSFLFLLGQNVNI